jgi:hypothetical protein
VFHVKIEEFTAEAQRNAEFAEKNKRYRKTKSGGSSLLLLFTCFSIVLLRELRGEFLIIDFI